MRKLCRTVPSTGRSTRRSGSIAAMIGAAALMFTAQAAAQVNFLSPGTHNPDPELHPHVFTLTSDQGNSSGPPAAGTIQRDFDVEITDDFTIKDIRVDLRLSGYSVNATDVVLFRSGTGSPNLSHRIRLIYAGCNYSVADFPKQISKHEAVSFGWRDRRAENYPIGSIGFTERGDDPQNDNDNNNPHEHLWNNGYIDPDTGIKKNPYVGWANHDPSEGEYSFGYGVSADMGEVCQSMNPSEDNGSWLSLPEGTYGIQKGNSVNYNSQQASDIQRWNELIDSSTRKDNLGKWTLRINWLGTTSNDIDPDRSGYTFSASNLRLTLFSDDRDTPTVVLTPDKDKSEPDLPVSVTIKFSEDMATELTEDRLVVSNGTIRAGTFEKISDSEYKVVIIPKGGGDETTVTVPDNAAQNAAAVGNRRGSTTINLSHKTRTEAIIQNFLARRADIIVSNEPDLVDRLLQREGRSKPVSGSFALSADHSYANVNLEPVNVGGFDLWAKTVWSKREDELTSMTSFLAYAGIDKMINEHTVLGVLGQIDLVEEVNKKDHSNLETSGWTVEGLGVLVGPYIVSRLHDNLIFDGRVAYGISDNEITPYEDKYSDDFTTKRWLAKAQLSGDFNIGRFVISPLVRWTYFTEESGSYINQYGEAISSLNVSLGRVTFGPTITHKYVRDDGGLVTTTFGVHGLWDYDKNDYVDTYTALPIGDTSDDLRARLELGLSFAGQDGKSIKLSGHYDGVGVDDLESYGGSVEVVFPFN